MGTNKSILEWAKYCTILDNISQSPLSNDQDWRVCEYEVRISAGTRLRML